MYSYDLGVMPTTKSVDTFGIIAFIIAIATSIVIYFVFMSKDNEKNLNGSVKKIYDYLHFESFIFEPFIKIAYICSSLYVTILSFELIGSSVGLFLLVLFGGNIIIRITYEACMMFYKIFKDVGNINKKLK